MKLKSVHKKIKAPFWDHVQVQLNSNVQREVRIIIRDNLSNLFNDQLRNQINIIYTQGWVNLRSQIRSNLFET